MTESQNSGQQADAAAPKKKNGFVDRVIPGAIFFILLIGCLLAPSIFAAILVALLATCSVWELFKMLADDGNAPSKAIGLIATAAFPFAYWFFGSTGLIIEVIALALAALVWFIFAEDAHFADAAITVFGPIYTGGLLTSILIMRMAEPTIWGGVFVLGVIVTTLANDVLAFCVGSLIGKHKMAPKISPKKSWEGLIAGIIGAIIVWCLLCLIPNISLPVWAAIICGLVSGVLSVLGDLAESRIKRLTGHKDSGSIMRGHGGILDRCDSMFTGMPAALVLLVIFGVIAL